MKKLVAMSLCMALLIGLSAPAQCDISINVRSEFVQASSVGGTWAAMFTDEYGNPATELNWTNMTLSTRVYNGSSRDVSISWRIADGIEGVEALNPEDMDAQLVSMGESLELELQFTRDAAAPLPADGMQVEYVVAGIGD